MIDGQDGILELPAMAGRKTRRRIPFNQIENLLVKVVNAPKSDSESQPKYAPAVVISGDAPATEKLAEWMDEKKAYEFVHWLRERVPCKNALQRPLAGRF